MSDEAAAKFDRQLRKVQDQIAKDAAWVGNELYLKKVENVKEEISRIVGY